MTSKLQQAAVRHCEKAKDMSITFHYDGEGVAKYESANVMPNSRSVDAFKAGAKWLLEEARKFAQANGPSLTSYVYLEDLEKLN